MPVFADIYDISDASLISLEPKLKGYTENELDMIKQLLRMAGLSMWPGAIDVGTFEYPCVFNGAIISRCVYDNEQLSPLIDKLITDGILERSKGRVFNFKTGRYNMRKNGHIRFTHWDNYQQMILF